MKKRIIMKIMKKKNQFHGGKMKKNEFNERKMKKDENYEKK